MNAIVDIGNTRTKLGLFVGENLHKSYIVDNQKELFEYLKAQSITAIILSTVVDSDAALLEQLNSIAPTILFTSTTKTPVINAYQSVSTLGSDRLAAACGAHLLYKGKPNLVIDAGTCVKYNFTDKNGNYLGGGISPGLTMRFKAMQHFTSKLPLVEFDENYHQLIGNNTKGSIKMGAQLGLVAEVKGIMEQYTSAFSDINIVLTGGDALFLQKALKSNIFADPDLILKGLNAILNYNK